jgi:hypothetical protein
MKFPLAFLPLTLLIIFFFISVGGDHRTRTRAQIVIPPDRVRRNHQGHAESRSVASGLDERCVEVKRTTSGRVLCHHARLWS